MSNFCYREFPAAERDAGGLMEDGFGEAHRTVLEIFRDCIECQTARLRQVPPVIAAGYLVYSTLVYPMRFGSRGLDE